MKKIIFIIFLALFIVSPTIANASLKTLTPCDEPIVDESGRKIKTCYLDLQITGNTEFQTVSGTITLTNTTYKSEPETVDSRVKMSKSGNSYVFTTTNSIKNETIRLAKFTIYFATNGKECNAEWSPNEYNVYYCENKNGYFYDLNGNIVSETEYNKQCKTHSCEIVDGTYFDKNGKVVSETEYNKQCKTHSCEIIDGTYFDKNNNIVTKADYEKQCTTPSCKIIDGIYYDKNGKAVTETEYDKQCNVHYCKIIDGTFFGKNGNIVSKLDWESQCQIEPNDTGGFFSIWTAIIGSVLLVAISIISKKINKVKKI